MATASINESRFRAALRSGEAKEVLMNKVDGAVFSYTPCIGTDRLGSCTAVLVVTPRGAVLGHVSPLPDGGLTYPEAGDDHIEAFMDRFNTYLDRYESLFPQGSPAWVVCAVFRGSIALPEQQSIIATKLRAARLNVNISETYHVPYTAEHPDRGTIFVDSRGSAVEVYVEDRIIHRTSKVLSSGVAQPTATQSDVSHGMADTSIGPWVWDNNHRRYRRLENNGWVWAPVSS